MLDRTDMDGMKKVARVLLMTDIHETEYSPIIIQHPFASSGIIMNPLIGIKEILNIAENETDLRKWQSAMEREIENAKNPFQIYMMINKPYCLTFLKFAMPHLSRKDFSVMLADAWVRSENPNMDRNLNRDKLLSMFRQADPLELMEENERQTLADMDDVVTVYRGVTSLNAKNVRAMSWTTDYDTAKWFAHRFGEEGTAYEAQIKKKYIYAYFDSRNEAEIILDPKYLTGLQIAQEEKMSIQLL